MTEGRRAQWTQVASVVITVVINLVVLAWAAGSIKSTVTSELARTREDVAELRGTIKGMQIVDGDHEARLRVLEAITTMRVRP